MLKSNDAWAHNRCYPVTKLSCHILCREKVECKSNFPIQLFSSIDERINYELYCKCCKVGAAMWQDQKRSILVTPFYLHSRSYNTLANKICYYKKLKN